METPLPDPVPDLPPAAGPPNRLSPAAAFCAIIVLACGIALFLILAFYGLIPAF